jgi:hypothetical protein
MKKPSFGSKYVVFPIIIITIVAITGQGPVAGSNERGTEPSGQSHFRLLSPVVRESPSNKLDLLSQLRHLVWTS